LTACWSQRLLFWSLLPFVAPQGLWVRRFAPRFADAAGPDSGVVGNGPTRRLLAIGDSIVAGVGVPTLEQALPGRFAASLARLDGVKVEWHAVGETGAGAVRLRTRLLARVPPRAFDIILVSVGVNDVTGLIRCATWTGAAGSLLDALRGHSPQAVVVVAGLPPLWGFPLLPQPLRYVFGVRARTFDELLRRVVAARDRCYYMATEFEPIPEKFSADGYHPSADSCGVWGEELATWYVENILHGENP